MRTRNFFVVARKMWSNILWKDMGIMPRRWGMVEMPCIEKVLPVPVWPGSVREGGLGRFGYDVMESR